MINNKTSIKISIGVCTLVSLTLLILIFSAPKLFELYQITYNGFLLASDELNSLVSVFMWCFYPCAVFGAVILYSLLKLLFNLHREEVFVFKNAFYLRLIAYCLLFIALITFAGGFFYGPFFFVSAAGFFVSMLLRVLKNVFVSAIELREESDLTI